MNRSSLERELELLNNALVSIDNFTASNNVNLNLSPDAPDVTERLSTNNEEIFAVVKGFIKYYFEFVYKSTC